MSISRIVRRPLVLLLAGLLVFAQMALAAHACSIVRGGSADLQTQAQRTVAGDMKPIAGHADFALSNPCVGHCQPAYPSAGEVPGSIPPAVWPAASFALPALPALTRSRQQAQPRLHAAAGPPAPVDPPHTILHCCLRN